MTEQAGGRTGALALGVVALFLGAASLVAPLLAVVAVPVSGAALLGSWGTRAARSPLVLAALGALVAFLGALSLGEALVPVIWAAAQQGL